MYWTLIITTLSLPVQVSWTHWSTVIRKSCILSFFMLWQKPSRSFQKTLPIWEAPPDLSALCIRGHPIFLTTRTFMCYQPAAGWTQTVTGTRKKMAIFCPGKQWQSFLRENSCPGWNSCMIMENFLMKVMPKNTVTSMNTRNCWIRAIKKTGLLIVRRLLMEHSQS